MNRYRATVSYPTLTGRRHHEFDIDASSMSTAASRAARAFDSRDEVSIKITCTGRNIVRERVERLSHGRVRAVP